MQAKPTLNGMSLLHKNSNVSNIAMGPQQGVCITCSPLLFIPQACKQITTHFFSPHDKPCTRGTEGPVVGATHKEHIEEIQ